MNNDLRIIFMGTPEFAVASLDILVQHQLNVVAVITAPDKPKGRGQKLVPSPVKEYALEHNLPILQPTNLKSPEFLDALKAYHANLQIVVAFRMLPEAVWSMPTLGTFNLHASLLPQYRGAAPINWAIINGEKETGVTTFFLKHQIDTGHIIFQEKEPITDTDTAGSLYERLMQKGAQLVLKTVEAIQTGSYPAVPQPDDIATREAPKIFKETCEIQWNQPAQHIVNFVRGLSPYPAAWTVLQDKKFKIYETSLAALTDQEPTPGTLHTDHKTYLHVKAQDQWIAIRSLQPDGKRRMTIDDFFRGNTL